LSNREYSLGQIIDAQKEPRCMLHKLKAVGLTAHLCPSTRSARLKAMQTLSRRTCGYAATLSCTTAAFYAITTHAYRLIPRFRHTVAQAQYLRPMICKSQPARHSLHITFCASQLACHSLHITACTSRPAHHSVHVTGCASKLACQALRVDDLDPIAEATFKTYLFDVRDANWQRPAACWQELSITPRTCPGVSMPRLCTCNAWFARPATLHCRYSSGWHFQTCVCRLCLNSNWAVTTCLGMWAAGLQCLGHRGFALFAMLVSPGMISILSLGAKAWSASVRPILVCLDNMLVH